MVFGMATRKVTLSLDQTAYALAESAAARAGISTSAWLSAAARREAVRLGAGSDWGDHHTEAVADDADTAGARGGARAAGGAWRGAPPPPPPDKPPRGGVVPPPPPTPPPP